MRRNAQPPETALVCLCILAIEYRRIYDAWGKHTHM